MKNPPVLKLLSKGGLKRPLLRYVTLYYTELCAYEIIILSTIYENPPTSFLVNSVISQSHITAIRKM
jgi:hypothetical protein